MTFSLNTVCLFPGRSVTEAVEIGEKFGFDTYEMWGVDTGIITELAELEKTRDIHFSAVVSREFALNDPSRRKDYLSALARLMDDMGATSCRGIITQVGQDNGLPRPEQHRSIVDGLSAAAELLATRGFTLLVEPLNSVKDHKGYYLTSSDEGFQIIREVSSPHVRLLFDIYHQLHMGEDVLTQVSRNLELIAHFHMAGFPARDERIFEGYDYRPLLGLLKDSGTDAPVGVELFPSSDAACSELLARLAELR